MPKHLIIVVVLLVCACVALWLSFNPSLPLGPLGATTEGSNSEVPATESSIIVPLAPKTANATEGSARHASAPDTELELKGGCRSYAEEPLADVVIQLCPAESAGGAIVRGAAVASTRSDATGGFSFRGVLRRGDRYVLHAVAAQLGECTSALIDPRRPDALWQDLRFGAAGRASGRVVDASGNAIVGAQCRRDDTGAVLACDSDGRFELLSVPTEGLRMRVAARGFRSVARLLKPEEHAEILMVPGLGVSGSVVFADDQSPVSGAVLWLRPIDETTAYDSEVTDRSGAFCFEGAAEGLLLLTTHIPGAAPRNVRAGDPPVHIEVARGALITGELIAADGTAARTGRVALVPFAESGGGALPVGAWKSVDLQGRFTLVANGPGTWFVVAEAPDCARTVSAAVMAPGSAQVRLVRGACLSGLIRDESGSAVEGATVAVRRVVPQRVTNHGLSGAVPGLSVSTTSAADGSFICGNLGAGDYEATVLHPSFVAREVRRFTLASAGQDLGTVVLARAGAIEGTVAGARGHADGTAVVLMVHSAGSRHVVSCDTTGRFGKDGLQPGNWTLSVIQSEGVLIQTTPVVTPLAAGGRMQVRLESR